MSLKRSSMLRLSRCTQCLSHITSRAQRFSTTARKAADQDDFALPSTSTSASTSTTRPKAHAVRPVPPPLPFVPDVKTFLTLIGRQCSTHTSKIPSWDALFSMTSQQLREAGVEPPRTRRYICWWRERFRQGTYGIGGDLTHVKNTDEGVAAYVQLVEVDANGKHLPRAQAALPAALKTPGKRAVIVNVPHDKHIEDAEGEGLRAVQFMKWLPLYKRIKGSCVDPVAGYDGRRAVLKVREGLWEQKRGRKVDGGERRQAEVRAKRRAKKNKEARDAAAHAAATATANAL